MLNSLVNVYSLIMVECVMDAVVASLDAILEWTNKVNGRFLKICTIRYYPAYCFSFDKLLRDIINNLFHTWIYKIRDFMIVD